jgi:uncharacterized protein (TIGR00251 family)
VRLTVRVQPRASRNEVAGRQGEAIKIRVTAPPVGGAANEAVIGVLADWLGLPRRAVAIVQGETARAKVVEIVTDHPEDLRRLVEASLQALVDMKKGHA